MGVGGGGCSFVGCLSNLTIDHASRWRRSTVPTPNGDTSNVWALNAFLPFICKKFLLVLSPSSLAVCEARGEVIAKCHSCCSIVRCR